MPVSDICGLLTLIGSDPQRSQDLRMVRKLGATEELRSLSGRESKINRLTLKRQHHMSDVYINSALFIFICICIIIITYLLIKCYGVDE